MHGWDVWMGCMDGDAWMGYMDGMYGWDAWIGQSGLTHQTQKLRMKRWIIAGIDDGEWDLSAGAAKHIGLGKAHFLADFADGLSEEACDRIANGVAPA